MATSLFIMNKNILLLLLLFVISNLVIAQTIANGGTINSATKISGVVVNQNNQPFKNIAVLVDGIEVCKTKEDGTFLVVPFLKFGQHQIQFFASSGRFATYTYHDAAGDAYFTVQLDTSFRQYYVRCKAPIFCGLQLPAFVLDSIYFVKNSANFIPSSFKYVYKLSEVLKNSPSFPLYATFVFVNNASKEIANKRAKNFVAALEKLQIDKDRIVLQFSKRKIVENKLLLSNTAN